MTADSQDILLIDIQGLQTSSWNRGMGRYSLMLLRKIFSHPKTQNRMIILIGNTLLRDKFREKYIFQHIAPYRPKVEYLDLPHQTATHANIKEHKKILNNYCSTLASCARISTLLLSVFEIGQALPVFPDTGDKYVLLYDLIPMEYPKEYLQSEFLRGEYFTRFSTLLEADHFFSISQTSVNVAIRLLGIEPQRFTVLTAGPIDFSSDISAPSQKRIKPYILFPSGDNWRKNTSLTITAFNQFNSSGKYDLVITSHFSPNHVAALSQLSDNCHFVGSVSDAELNWYYEHSAAVAFPSLSEGLGLPILEAISHNKPVIVSSIPIFEEIGNLKSFCWCDPQDVTSIANAIGRAVNAVVTSSEKETLFNKWNWTRASDELVGHIYRDKSKPRRSSNYHKVKIDMYGPPATSKSAIGLFATEVALSLKLNAQLNYWSEISEMTSGKDISYTDYMPWVQSLSKSITRTLPESKRIYHIGNSKYHCQTYLLARMHPGLVVLHESELIGLHDAIVEQHPAWKKTIALEAEFERSVFKSTTIPHISGLLSAGNQIVVHSKMAFQTVATLAKLFGNPVHLLNFPIASAEKVSIRSAPQSRKLRLAIAGSFSSNKRLEELLSLLPELSTKYLVVLFGRSSYDPFFFRLKQTIEKLENIFLFTDVSVNEFNSLTSASDFLIALRDSYHGEASRTVMEALRVGAIPIVSNVGWFSELPNELAIKINDTSELRSILLSEDYLRSKILNYSEKSLNDFLQCHTMERYSQRLLEIVSDN